jgi:hypothetical protein
MPVSENFMKIVRVAALAVLVITAALLIDLHEPKRVSAQNAGSVGIAAQMIPVFSNQSTTASSAIFNDIGQGQNALFFVGNNFSGTVDLEWSPTKVPPFYPITQANFQGDSNSHIIQFGSYFPNIRSTITPTSGSASAWYSSSSGPVSFAAPALGTNGPTSPIFCDRMQNAGPLANAGTVNLAPQVNPGDRVILCSMEITFVGAPAAGTYTVLYYGLNNCTGSNTTVLTQATTASTPQTLVFSNMFVSDWYFPALQSPCLVNNSGTSLYVTSSYASVHQL